MSLTFNAERHEYRWDGLLVPNVTKILSPLTADSLARIDPDVLEKARQEGVDCHRMVELEAKGDLDEESLPEWLRPKLAAYRKFVADTGFAVWESEERMYSYAYNYAGTCDLIGQLRECNRPVCVDLKRSLYGGRSIGLQLAGYSMMWDETHPDHKIKDRYALVLNDGDYRLTQFSDPRDRSVFLAALTLWRWRQEK